MKAATPNTSSNNKFIKKTLILRFDQHEVAYLINQMTVFSMDCKFTAYGPSKLFLPSSKIEIRTL